VHVQSSDEIGELGAVFNEMAGSIRESQGTLEQRVAQRTQELSFANDLLKRSESQLQTANQDLAAANRLKSEFLANMSHELRTPLNAIIGFSELLQDQVFGQLNERQAKYVSNILTSGRHLLQLINDILDLSKIEAGRMELHLESFSLQDALGEVETIVQPLATRKRVKLQLSLEGNLPAVVADRSKLKQIMYNLLSNATKFTPESGTVTVHAEVSEGQVQVAVRDTGIGIRPEDKDQIFQEFRQADGSAARQYEGTGLGLALTRRFVQMHGGRIWVDSEVGHGSTFTFSLPLRTLETESPILVPGDSAKGRGHDECDVTPDPLVLVVEDDPQSRELLGLALTQSGYRVAYAVDGDEALELAAELLPFAVTLDIMLPKRDGWQVLRDLKGDPATEGIPVIIVSILDNRDLGFSLGAADYLVKPVDRAELLKRLGRFSFTTKVKSQVVRVLTIDDDPKAVDLVSTLLHSEGFEVLRAYGGQEGIDKALIEQPDAIILDLMMPEVSGFGVIQRLKQDARACRIPIFVLTAMDLTDEVRRELNGQVAAVARKGAGATGELLAELAKLERITPGWSRAGVISGGPDLKPGTAARCNA
jgi:signal transduction histidine kinase/DNA-binding response OmpR family regulator